ncbi:MAG: GH39 family glycosyl hydrolase [Armatimonadota bacterium]
MKVTLDTSLVTPFPHFWETVLGSEGAHYAARPDLHRHYQRAHKAFGTSFIRNHGVLHDTNLVYFEDDLGHPYYRFDGVDRCYDPLVHIGMRPFVELSFMPEALARAATYIFHWQGDTAPPRDLCRWEDLVRAFTRHCVDRYGLNEVRQWYFEVWNEPNIGFWSGTQQEYWALYDAAARAIKSVDPLLKVGGPATAGAEWVREMLDHCAEADSPIDFVSYHGYPTDEGYVIAGQPMTFKGTGFWCEAGRRNYEIVRASDFPNVEIHVTEWNSSPGSRDFTHDTTYGAAYLCQGISEVAGYVDTFSYWTVSDIFQEGGYPFSEFHGGFGLLTVHGVRKPSWHAFQLLHRLGGERVAATITDAPDGTGVIATRTTTSLQMIAWYFRQPPVEQAQREALTADIPLPDGEYRLTEYLIDAEHGNPLAAWEEMGKPDRPNAQQLAILHAIEPGSETRRITITGGCYTYTTVLTPGTVRLIELEEL